MKGPHSLRAFARRINPSMGVMRAQLGAWSGGRVSGPGARLLAGERVPPALHRGREAGLIELRLREAILARAVFDEAVGNAEREGGQRGRAVREQFDDRGAGAAGDGVFFDGDERGMFAPRAAAPALRRVV